VTSYTAFYSGLEKKSTWERLWSFSLSQFLCFRKRTLILDTRRIESAELGLDIINNKDHMNEDELYSFAAKKRPGHACTPDPNLRKLGQVVVVSQCFLLTMALLLQFEKPKSVDQL